MAEVATWSEWIEDPDGSCTMTVEDGVWDYGDGIPEGESFTAVLSWDGEAKSWQVEVEHDSRGSSESVLLDAATLDAAKDQAEGFFRTFILDYRTSAMTGGAERYV